ncbi:MAG TPA: hypothetical protein VNX21_08210, partial [Candidatus Thermoplasmatota archaeon]|nr:hypothetical protein [Candidatus Thermoplasmatota archaeon]
MTVLALAAVPASATHNNRGTVKVHDNEVEDPDQRNVPHVSCDFWIEGFMLGDDSGWLVFLSWPPTGNKSEVAPSGAGLEWSADAGEVSGEFHFLQGPFQLPPGHYRVEVYTEDGHPGGGGHFAKSKTFWVEPCETPVVHPPCPPGLEVQARSTAGHPDNFLQWQAVAGATGYNVYRAVEGGDFEYQVTIDAPYTSYVDDRGIEVGVTYEYYVTALVNGVESENCEVVEVTAIPFFPTLVVGGLA